MVTLEQRSDSASLSSTSSVNSLLPSPNKTYLSEATRQEIVALQREYPSGEQLLAAYSPNITSRLLAERNLERIYMGRAPEMSIVREAYGMEVAVSWLEIQLNHISEFAGVKERMNALVVHELAQVILGEFHWLKLSEMMLFFARLMAGRYGVFYGVVDPMHISASLHTFLRERNMDIDRIEREMAQRRREEEWRKRL